MRKIGKILSLILTISLVASCFVMMNVSATSKAHTITLAQTPTTGLKAGDTVTVTLSLDSTADVKSLGYRVVYDTNFFEIDMTKGWESDEDYESHENFIDKEWYDGLLTSVWGKKLSTFGYKAGSPANAINFTWAGTAVPATKVESNFVIGKFNFKIKTTATGTGVIKIDSENSESADTGENFGATITGANQISIELGSSTPTPVAPIFGATTSLGSDGVAITGKDGVKYDNAFAVSATVTPNDATEIGVLFIPAKVLGEGTLTNETETAVKAVYDKALGTGAVTFKAAIKDIPRFLQGVSFDMVSRAYAKTGTTYNYGTAATTTVQFGNTGNVD